MKHVEAMLYNYYDTSMTNDREGPISLEPDVEFIAQRYVAAVPLPLLLGRREQDCLGRLDVALP